LVTLLKWLQRIPSQDLQANAYLCAGCSWVYILSGQIDQAEDFLRAAEAALAAYQPHYIASEGRVVTGEEIQADLAAVQAFYARMRGDAASTITYSQQALEGLPAADHSSRGAVTLNLGLLQMEQGNLDAAKDLFAEAAEIALRTNENRYVAATALNFHGSILKYQGALDEAADCYRQLIGFETDLSNPAVDISDTDTSTPDTSAAAMGHLGLAEIHFQRNQLVEATQHLMQALQAPHPTSDVLIGVYLMHAQLSLLAEICSRLKVGSTKPTPSTRRGWTTCGAPNGLRCAARTTWRAATSRPRPSRDSKCLAHRTANGCRQHSSASPARIWVGGPGLDSPRAPRSSAFHPRSGPRRRNG